VAYGQRTAPVFLAAGAGATPVSASVSGLAGGSTYHFRAVATNDDGRTETADATFAVPAFAPVITLQRATNVVADRATLAATITSNGSTGTARFQYTDAANFAGPLLTSEERSVKSTDEAKEFSATVSALVRNQTYRFRLVFQPTTGAVIETVEQTFFTNQTPVAKADTFNLSTRRATSLDVLKNDSDKDGDPRLVTQVGTAAKGVATPTVDGLRIVYEPGAAFRGTDGFTYTITDGFPAGTASATVTIRAFGTLLAGNHGGLIVDANGEAVGYFRVTTTETGAFTGSVRVGGGKESFSGAFGSDGKFRGSIEIDGRLVPVTLAATVDGTATSVAVDFDDGRWTAALRTTEASASERAAAAGRYTVEFPSGTSTSDAGNEGGNPAGSGWAALKLGADGAARVKGRLPDGRTFSTRGVLGIASTGPVVTFFDDPRHTRLSGTLSLDDAVAGTLQVVRDSGGDGPFAGGYTLQSTASGARYVPPADGKRVIEGAADASGRRLTFAVTGSNPAETFTRNLRLNEDDKVTVVDRDAEGLKVKIDRDSGRFTVSFTGATDDQHIKGTGVFIQGSSRMALGRGAGVFKGENGTGKITITAGSAAPEANPTPTPDPGTITVRP
jgi:hypothetical protein